MTQSASHGSRRVLRCLALAAIVGALFACDEQRSQQEVVLSNSLAVLHAVPDIRGRAVCNVDSLASRTQTEVVARCDFGHGVTATIHGDTIFSVERTVVPPVPDSGQSLLDYWNSHLRHGWEAALGGRPDNLNSHRSDQSNRFEAIWDTPTGVRQLITLERTSTKGLVLQHLSIDCRERDRHKQAIACW